MGLIVSLITAAAGVALVVVGLFLLFGPVAMVACGVVLVVAGVLIDWEALSGKPARTPPR